MARFKKKILLLILLVVTCFYTSCIPSLDQIFSPSDVSGIVKSRYGYEDQSSYTHKYLNTSIKALPLIITTGTFKNSSEQFVEMEFMVYNKKQPINYKYIELFNSKGDKWEWEVYPKHKSIKKERHFIIESYRIRIDSQVKELLKFFKDQTIYLKFIGDVNNFKKLDEKHRDSLLKVLQYANNLYSQ